jgi:hypothetical protein
VETTETRHRRLSHPPPENSYGEDIKKAVKKIEKDRKKDEKEKK